MFVVRIDGRKDRVNSRFLFQDESVGSKSKKMTVYQALYRRQVFLIIFTSKG